MFNHRQISATGVGVVTIKVATKDEAAAITSKGKGAAEVIEFKNKAEAAGWQRSVEAFEGDGSQYAQYVQCVGAG